MNLVINKMKKKKKKAKVVQLKEFTGKGKKLSVAENSGGIFRVIIIFLSFSRIRRRASARGTEREREQAMNIKTRSNYQSLTGKVVFLREYRRVFSFSMEVFQ